MDHVNEQIECACGCGTSLDRWIDYGGNGWPSQIKERKYVHGHNKPWLGKKLPEYMCNAISERQLGVKRGPMPEETRRKLSVANKGQIPWSKGTRGLIKQKRGRESPHWKGGPKQCQHANCDNIVTANNSTGLCHLHSRANKGENHYNWQGGITAEGDTVRKSAKYAEWRAGVFERDHYTCQHCGDMGACLHAHHVKPFAERKDLRLRKDNGLTLCKECHLNVHFRS